MSTAFWNTVVMSHTTPRYCRMTPRYYRGIADIRMSRISTCKPAQTRGHAPPIVNLGPAWRGISTRLPPLQIATR